MQLRPGYNYQLDINFQNSNRFTDASETVKVDNKFLISVAKSVRVAPSMPFNKPPLANCARRRVAASLLLFADSSTVCKFFMKGGSANCLNPPQAASNNAALKITEREGDDSQ